jgi:hypothetical protein
MGAARACVTVGYWLLAMGYSAPGLKSWTQTDDRGMSPQRIHQQRIANSE